VFQSFDTQKLIIDLFENEESIKDFGKCVNFICVASCKKG
jgi:hypothetical protein